MTTAFFKNTATILAASLVESSDLCGNINHTIAGTGTVETGHTCGSMA